VDSFRRGLPTGPHPGWGCDDQVGGQLFVVLPLRQNDTKNPARRISNLPSIAQRRALAASQAFRWPGAATGPPNAFCSPGPKVHKAPYRKICSFYLTKLQVLILGCRPGPLANKSYPATYRLAYAKHTFLGGGRCSKNPWQIVK